MLSAVRILRGLVGVVLCAGLLLASGAVAMGSVLPDGRVYEQVSPVDKSGGDVLSHSERTVAAASGSAVAFTSLEGFGDVAGFGVATDYVARRGADGAWATHGITPPQQPLEFILLASVGFEPRYGLFSNDLARGVFLARSPLSDTPNVAKALNLYVRQDVLAPGAGSYSLLSTASTVQDADPQQQPLPAAAAADFSHVLFESKRNLTADTSTLDTSEAKLYEWVEGSVRLAGILPDGSPTVSEAGQGALTGRYTDGTISEDGSRVIFTAPPYADSHTGGVLYVRDDKGTVAIGDDETVRVSTSERTDCNDDPTCGGDAVANPTPDPTNPGGVEPPATFAAASADGTRIFFTTSEQMTDDDVNHTRDLYKADLLAPAGERLTRISVDDELSDNGGGDVHNGHDVSGVLGASADGSAVYFTVALGQLVADGRIGDTGAPTDGDRIFLWRDGSLRHVGSVSRGIESSQINGSLGLFSPKWSRVTPDGSHLLFVTQGSQELLSLYGGSEYNHGQQCPGGRPCSEVYVYNANANGGTGGLQCASCNPTGQTATANADLYGGWLEQGAAKGTFYLNHALSDDGRFVFFNSAERLSSDDKNSAEDAYEFDTTTGEVHLISSGRGTSDQLFMDASPDGHDVFFTSREQLRSTDRDGSQDLYDARVNGAPDPGVPVVTPCTGDGCRGAASGRSSSGLAPSVGADGAPDRVERRGAAAAYSIQAPSDRQRRRMVRRGKGQIEVVRSRSGRVDLTLKARIGGEWRTVDTGSASSRDAGPVRIGVKLDAAVRNALARRGHVRLRVVATYSQSSAQHVMAFTLKQGGR